MNVHIACDFRMMNCIAIIKTLIAYKTIFLKKRFYIQKILVCLKNSLGVFSKRWNQVKTGRDQTYNLC